MSFSDIFKSSFLENVMSVSVLDMVLALALAFGIGVFIFFVYKSFRKAQLFIIWLISYYTRNNCCNYTKDKRKN